MKNIIFIVLLFIPLMLQAEIYKWVDAEGNTHYGDKPVKDSQQMDIDIRDKGNIKTSQSRENKRRKLISSFDDDRDRENKEKKKRKEERKKMARNCVLAKDRLRQYERVRYLYSLDMSGSRVVVPDDVRKKNTELLRKQIREQCK
ncbi:hypothetical protein MNBD_GAMMA09-542 [hydrothermal vent metagenome]|uniref:DUF4124 domain-containing protein n=1 Tax=hydrothermal vent metagenome TaxID=652676 RepID=A0A3B0XJP5_9ZZZZ